MYKTLKLEVDTRGVARLTLNRADKHNALSGEMIAELALVTPDIAKRNDIRVVVLAAQGRSFCAGGDLEWMKAQIDATNAQRRDEAGKLARMLFALNTLPQPLIGRVQGQAFGGGVGLMSVCDVAIGVKGARFGLTETRLGLIPATISPYVIARMGEANARRVFMSGRVFEADEAVTLGLLARAVTAEALDAEIEAEVAPYLACAPGAVAAAKRLTRALGPPITDAVIDDTIERLVATWEGNEAVEGIAAFFEKRRARWH